MGGQAAKKEGERQGDFLGGKYLLEDCLGIGGMGEVYRATNVSLGRKVAIKLLNKEHTSNEDDVMRFLREARAAAAVRHPNVVDVFDVARDDDGTPFIVQELLAGQDLEQYLAGSDGRLPAEEALEIMIPVADAVAAAHKQSVVHRDLKPANIFLAREGNRIIPKVLDFGACLYQTVGALSAKEQRMLIGTPHYMAPEQITTAMDVDARADVWAMGVILYELLVGETPFEAEDGAAVMRAVRTRNVQPLRKMAPAAPVMLEALVTRCLDRDRKKRYADAAVVRDELEGIKSDLRSGGRARGATDNAADASRSVAAQRSPRVDPRKEDDGVSSTGHRLAAIVLKPKVATKRRGSSLLTLSSPDEVTNWDGDRPAPKSVERPIEAAKAVRTAADVIREADAASAAADSSRSASSRSARDSSMPPSLNPALAMTAVPLSPRTAALGAAAPPSRPTAERGAARGFDLHDTDDPLLDLEITARETPGAGASRPSSIPPVLDPRAFAPRSSSSDPPPASQPGPTSKPASEAALDKLRAPQSTPRESALTPPLSPPRSPSLADARVPLQGPGPRIWTRSAKLTLGTSIALPAFAAFVALRFAPFVLAPLGHAMRGDTPLASGVLAVLTLVGAAALAARALGSSRSPSMVIATVGAVLLGILMIIVTFSASETAELGVPPAVGGLVPFIAPIIPLGLGLAAFGRARRAWLSPYERTEAVQFVVLTSFMLLALLELGPRGAVRAATLAAPASPPAAVPARPASP